jgi:hypothetical protein
MPVNVNNIVIRRRAKATFLYPGVIALIVAVFFFFPPRCAAANHFVRSAATGANSGADWTNAFTDLPASLIRGDIYYVAAGNYHQHTFNDPDSGTSVIEIRAATIADHGGTVAGWQDTFQGNANFAPTTGTTPSRCVFEFRTDFYLINGNGTGIRSADWQSGYLITVDDSSAKAGECVVMIGGSGGGTPGAGTFVHDITIDYLESNGSHTTTDSGVHEQGVEVRCGAANVAVRHSYVHDGGSVLFFIKGTHDLMPSAALCNASSTGSQLILEFNYLARDYSSSAIHGEGIECDEGQSCTIRFNRFRDIDGTAFIATPSGGGGATNNIDNQWDIYGNWFELKNPHTLNNVPCGVAGVIQAFDVVFSGPLHFYNNTIANVNSTICPGTNGSTPMIFIQQGSLPAVLNGGLFVENNLWYNSDSFTAVTTSSCSRCSTVVWTNNAYFSQNVSDPDSGKQVATGNPFVGSAIENYHLVASTNTGTVLLAPFNVDMDGRTRAVDGIWDRGAFQFDSGNRPPLPPPQVTATVH